MGFHNLNPTSNTNAVILNVYQASNERNVTVVGATARSVGAAGVWVQGGGHSLLGGLYGLGMDSKLGLQDLFT